MITVLAGGTGSVKLVRGLAAQENDVCVISNVGDNYWVYGMYVCPDIDTMVYGLADLLDSKRSWGIKNDSFNFLRQMEVFGEETWFRMGDRDAATNLMRTNMLKGLYKELTKAKKKSVGVQSVYRNRCDKWPCSRIHESCWNRT